MALVGLFVALDRIAPSSPCEGIGGSWASHVCMNVHGIMPCDGDSISL